ncbi:MAG: chromate transporter [Lachnospiraceae bacterium]|nr:chromate transporter [Lachnospiraceae bacterium]
MEQQQNIPLWKLFLAFFKCGAVTFGGGYAKQPILDREIVDKRGWITKEEVMDYYAVAQALPGIISINVASFIGHKLRKIPGAIMGVLGVISPCIIVITAIAMLFSNFQDNEYVVHALQGINIAVAALIINTIITMWKKGVKEIPQFLIFLVVFCLSLFIGGQRMPIYCVIGSLIFALVYKRIERRVRSK